MGIALHHNVRWLPVPDPNFAFTIVAMRLASKVAIVTGGASGIGHAIAMAFAREGAQVVICGRDRKKLDAAANEIGPSCLALQADVSEAAGIRKLLDSTVQRFGRVNVLVNNAGVLLPGTAESLTEAEWDRTFTVNVRGLWLLSRAVLTPMRLAGGGSIINMGSVLSLVGARNRVAYSASKSAVLGMTRAMALDHAADRIRVNCICPGMVETEMVAPFIADEDAKRQRVAMHPVGRLGQPGDMTGAAVFLASDESSWTTGAAFPVDGGYTAI